ncbi:MAG: YkgJ family cysteine cluster protein [Pseudomonadota bacterium]
MKQGRNVPVGVKITTENKCGFCTNSKCCTYITEELATPRSMHDFDHMLWQLSHRDIQAYKDEDGWYLLVNNSCTHLLPDGRCGIYDDRPLICREYTNDYCEFDEPAERGFDLFFEDYAALLKYVKKRFKTWHKYAASRDQQLRQA